MLELNGKVAIVTGAGRQVGIGRHAALELARLGADVVVTGTNRSPDTFTKSELEVNWKGTESVVNEVRGLGRKSLALTLDVTNHEQVENVVSSTLKEFGRIDILVILLLVSLFALYIFATLDVIELIARIIGRFHHRLLNTSSD